MVAIPIADSVCTAYFLNPIENDVSSLQNEKYDLTIGMEAENVDPVKCDNAEPAMAANGNDAQQHNQNVPSGRITPPIENSWSKDQQFTMDVLRIIESYGVDFEKNGVSWKGFQSFVPIVLAQIERQESIRMILPAFPFKSPNSRDKVLGKLPDFGEELALAHLNGLCQNIAEVYSPGADVYISSDGLVYNG